MNTPTHMLVSASVFGEPDRPEQNSAALAGAVMPDTILYTLWGGALLLGYSEETIWGKLYELPVWQELMAIGDSILLYVALLGIAWVMARQLSLENYARLLAIFSASALLHIALDFPVHADDAHRHFWPISDWRFHSPISYWDPAHYGNIVGWIEVFCALILTVDLWRRFNRIPVRIILAINLSHYFLVPAYFSLTLG